MGNHVYTMPQVFMDDKSVPTHWRLLGYLNGFFLNGKSVWASNETIAKELHVDEKSITRAVSKLEKLQLIKTKRTKNSRVIKSYQKDDPVEEVTNDEVDEIQTDTGGGGVDTNVHATGTFVSMPDGHQCPSNSDNNADNNANSKTKVLPGFDFEAEVKKLLNPPENRVCKIVHWYVKTRKIVCRTEKEWKSEKGRLFKSAKELEGYNKKEMEYCIRYFQEKKLSWTLETLARNAKLILNENKI